MNRDHHEKLARVNAWLRTTFDGDRIPPFQASEENVERLYALCCSSEQVCLPICDSHTCWGFLQRIAPFPCVIPAHFLCAA
jgi:hypothetical protein